VLESRRKEMASASMPAAYPPPSACDFTVFPAYRTNTPHLTCTHLATARVIFIPYF